ncbi:MAG: hypothetical protein IIY95_06850, partial [Firmicutes bacterium]|nr:hypothetical protein [Bacillota bacterium]
LEGDYLWTRPCGKTFSRPDMLRGDYVGHLGEPVHIRVFEKDGQLQADLAGEPCRLDYCEATVFAANSLTTGKRITFLRFFIQNGHAWAVKNGSLLFRRV